MSAAVISHRSVAARSRSPTIAPLYASRVRINPACVARPEDAAKDAKRRRCRDEEPPRSRSPGVKPRRRDGERGVSPDRRRKRDGVSRADNGRRDSSSGDSRSRTRPASSTATSRVDVHARRADAHRTAKIKDGECAQEARRKSGSERSRSRSEPRARPDPAAARHQLPASVTRPRAAALDRWPLQERTEMGGEAECMRRRNIQRKREEARREMDKVVRTVEFNDPFISPKDVFKS